MVKADCDGSDIKALLTHIKKSVVTRAIAWNYINLSFAQNEQLVMNRTIRDQCAYIYNVYIYILFLITYVKYSLLTFYHPRAVLKLHYNNNKLGILSVSSYRISHF